MAEREDRSWGQAKRFEFIEWRLFWLGRMNRRDIEQEFGISTPQASIDLRNYQEAAPGNLTYDATQKTFVRTEEFTPRFVRISGDRFLLQMRALHTGAIDISDTWFPEMPNVDVLPKPSRNVSNEIVRTIVSAISKGRALIISYRSLTKTKDRIIGPHALAYDGSRWHIRAWCFENKEFRDFLITRITEAVEAFREDFSPEKDLEWSRLATLRLRPHPELNSEQRKTIEYDFGMTDGYADLSVRLAMAFYFIRQHNLDKNISLPERQQFILENLSEVEEQIARAKEDSRNLANNLA